MEANLKPDPNLFPQVPGHTPPNQREGLTSARYSTQNFKSSEEPLKRTEKKTHIRIGYPAKALLGTVSISPRRLRVVPPLTRERRGQVWGAEQSLEQSSLTHPSSDADPGNARTPFSGDPLTSNGQVQGVICIPEGLLPPRILP